MVGREDVDVHICRRVIDHPMPPVRSISTTCADCGASIWASPASLAAADGAETICIPCAQARYPEAGDLEFLPPTEGQRREMGERLFGMGEA